MENTNNADKLNELNEEMYHEMLQQTGVRGKTLLFCRDCYREDVE
jgi:hypothetical protein